jgi:hypothetical protein
LLIFGWFYLSYVLLLPFLVFSFTVLNFREILLRSLTMKFEKLQLWTMNTRLGLIVYIVAAPLSFFHISNTHVFCRRLLGPRTLRWIHWRLKWPSLRRTLFVVRSCCHLEKNEWLLIRLMVVGRSDEWKQPPGLC